MTAPVGHVEITLALQAGGASRRMGRNKALVPFADGSLIEWQLRRTRGLFGHTLVVSNEPTSFLHLGVPVVTDAVQERGSVVGIYTSLLASPTPYVLCLACDVPLVSRDLLRALAAGAAGYDAFVPRHGRYLEPMVAVYRREAIGTVGAFLDGGGRRIDSLFGKMRTGYLDVDPSVHGPPDRIFLNVNTPAELERARRLAQHERETRGDPGTPGTPGGRPAAEGSPGRFLAGPGVPVVSVVGRKKSGKTTLLVRLIAELSGRGVRVAALKHDRHGFEIDVPGTDSHRFREAGAVVTAISGPQSYAVVHDVPRERSLEEIVDRLGESVDLVLTEGYKFGPAPKIEVLGGGLPGDPDDPVSPVGDLLAVVEGAGWDRARRRPSGARAEVPLFDSGDVRGLADLLTGHLAAVSQVEVGS